MIKVTQKSFYDAYAGQELEWLGMDSKETYEENLINKRELLEQHGWLDRKITYKFNKHGFRSDEFSEGDSVMFLGCSHTIGVGLPLESTWTYLVAQRLNLKYYNLSIGGGSNDSAFRMAYNYVPILKPKLVIFLLPRANRLEVISHENDIYNVGPEYYPEHYHGFFDSWLSNDDNPNINLMRNLLAINSLCDMHKIKFLYFYQSKMPRLDLARDLAHRGVVSNVEISNIVVNEVFKN